jgi:type I restriction enzyme S subunit
MELMPGYKRSDVGVIPEDWDVLPLGECLVGRPSYGINAAAVPYSDALPVYIRITDISEDGRFSPDKFVSVKSEQACNYYLSDGDIVFARTGASVGKSYRYNPKDGALVFAGFLIRVMPDANKLHPAFAAAYVTTGNYWRWVRLMSMRSGQPGINGNEYSQLPIPLPPLPEQCAIAQALSDVDELLGSLEKMIAKKRDLKQAAMKHLLTGKTRLPGFTGAWETQQLKVFAHLSKTGINPSSTPESLFTHFSLPAFDANESPVIESGASIGSNKFIVPPGAVLLSKLNPRIPRVWAPNCIPSNSVCSTEFLVLIPNEGVDRNFFKYLCASTAVASQMELHAIGTTGSHQRIHPTQVMAIEVKTPTDDEERSAISSVLRDIDAELSNLNRRRDKTVELKQAMMQELLTGKTRLA